MTLLDRVATAPISWGVCEVPGWGHQLTPDRVLSEMAELGFTKTELGSAGWLPSGAADIRAALEPHNLELLASFIPLVMHVPEHGDEALSQATEAAQMLSEAGARYFNTAPVTSSEWEPRSPVTDGQLTHMAEMFDEVDKICRRHGIHQVVHEHFGCVIETGSEVEWVLEATEVDLVLDTGHLALGGASSIDLVRDHVNRIGLVHLKDTNCGLIEDLTSGNKTLMESVQAGIFPALGEGDLSIDKVIMELEDQGYDGWYVIEQDVAITGDLPAAGQGPMVDVATSLAFLSDIAESLPVSTPSASA